MDNSLRQAHNQQALLSIRSMSVLGCLWFLLMQDGGVRRGTDILKALALGASAVLLGRPVLYGLAVGGHAGVRRVLQLLHAELELAMALAGCASLKDITSRLVIPAQPPAGWPLTLEYGCSCCGSSGAAGQLQSQGVQRASCCRQVCETQVCSRPRQWSGTDKPRSRL